MPRAAPFHGTHTASPRAVVVTCLLALCLLGLAPRAAAQIESEYRVKAGFLLNFAVFTEWPERGDAPLTICVYGEDPFGPVLDELAARGAGGRRFDVRRTFSVDTLARCQLVFITRTMMNTLGRVLDTVASAPVLTVADSPGALQRGVMLNMDTGQSRITFSANLGVARRQGLKISARLLSLATEVSQ